MAGQTARMLINFIIIVFIIIIITTLATSSSHSAEARARAGNMCILKIISVCECKMKMGVAGHKVKFSNEKSWRKLHFKVTTVCHGLIFNIHERQLVQASSTLANYFSGHGRRSVSRLMQRKSPRNTLEI